ncbi:beta-lactamase family protein [Bifidobacterium amazonense]|uniref:Beta-lactamase family protein n=1 Tax=Bifidobacterium amazonense TaxID=2809027 RepID=A0ABS9VSM4_9BIFI|nr:serine hydrolase domain-containing protein [Bifidobacterium amazonense]MCH9275094.1 beta-lactamase family protein [Bifidobacterium amazonense]
MSFPSIDATQEVRRILSGLISERKTPGYAYAVFDRSGLVLSGGGGVKNATLPASDENVPTSSTAFRIASMSKSFTIAAVLKLASEGTIDISRPVEEYVPQLKGLKTYRSDDLPVLIHQLMSMSSGLATDDPWADRQESLSRTDFQALMRRGFRFIFSPGEDFEYSNTGFAILGELVKLVSGKSMPEYVRTEFLNPLGMEHTSYDYQCSRVKNIATGHSLSHDKWVTEPFTDPGSYSSIGGVISTVEDIATWATWLADAYENDDDSEGSILPAPYRRIMQVGHIAIPPVLRSGSSRGRLCVRDTSEFTSYGYGLFVEHDPRLGDIVYHPGGYPGYGSAMIWHKDSGIGMVVLANGRYAPAFTVARRALNVLLQEANVAGRSYPLWPETEHAMQAVTAMITKAAEHAEPDAASSEDVQQHVIRAYRHLQPMLSMNVDMDCILEERGINLAQELAISGRPVLEANGRCRIDHCASETPAHVTWTIPCERTPLLCELRMNPLDKPQIETVVIKHKPAISADDIVTVSRTTTILES